jgi:hypothetical protein
VERHRVLDMMREAEYSVQYVTEPMAYWLAAAGILIQLILAAMMYSSPVWVGDSNGVMFLYSLVVLSIGLLGIYWLRSDASGKIKFGSLLLIISAVMSFTTMWGLVTGSGLMISGGALAIASIRPILRVPQWSEIISR